MKETIIEKLKQIEQQHDVRILWAIPPYGETNTIPADTTCVNGKLTNEQKWGLMSPYVIALLDGQKVEEWPEGTAREPEDMLSEIFGN